MRKGFSMEDISFEDLGLEETVLAAVAAKGFEHPTPIQVLAIPRLLSGETNVIAKARTGTGKTAAFGLPLVQQIRTDTGTVQALVLAPTRELALQVCREIDSFATNGFPRTTAVYGGQSMGEQLRALKRGVEIVVGTPGRIQDHLERGTLDLSSISYFILDEADEMLDMGFIEDIEAIFAQANPDSRILLFSATMPPAILKIAANFMGDYEIVEEETHPEEPVLTEQKYWLVREQEKIEALIRLIDISPQFYGLVFTQTKNDADSVARALDERGYEAAALHGDIPQNQREKILYRFRTKKTRILAATDVAARGIDIEGLTHVVNYALPFDAPTYIHRIGRTGRAGAKGLAFTFVRPEERRKLEYLKSAVRKATKGNLEEAPIPDIDEVLDAKRSRIFTEMQKTLGFTDIRLGKRIIKPEAVLGRNPDVVRAAIKRAISEGVLEDFIKSIDNIPTENTSLVLDELTSNTKYTIECTPIRIVDNIKTQMDKSSLQFETSETSTTATEVISKNNFVITASKGQINIQLSDIAQVSVFTITGKCIYNKKSSSNMFNIPVPESILIVKITDKHGNIFTEKKNCR